MAASKDTRYHEAGHAVAAHMLGIGLKEEGMILYSDSNAEVMVADRPNGASEDWIIRRVAAKLAGPVAMCLKRREKLDWESLKCSKEYYTDIQYSERILCEYYLELAVGPNRTLIDERMNRSFCLAMDCVQKNQALIDAVADAAEGRDQLSRSEIIACIQACQQ